MKLDEATLATYFVAPLFSLSRQELKGVNLHKTASRSRLVNKNTLVQYRKGILVLSGGSPQNNAAQLFPILMSVDISSRHPSTQAIFCQAISRSSNTLQTSNRAKRLLPNFTSEASSLSVQSQQRSSHPSPAMADRTRRYCGAVFRTQTGAFGS